MPISEIMAPFQEDGNFRFDGVQDEEFHFFHTIMRIFNGTVERLEQINLLCESKEFRSIYLRRGAPAYYRFYVPLRVTGNQIKVRIDEKGTRQPKKLSASDSFSLLRTLKRQVRTAGKKMSVIDRRKLELRFYRRVIATRCTVIESICSAVYQVGMEQLLWSVKHEKDNSFRKDAMVKLIKLDPGCITAPGADAVIREAAIGSDHKYLRAISKAVDPDRRLTELEDQRNRHALTILAFSMKFKDRRLDDYQKFFAYYNSTLAKAPECKESWFFPNYLQRDTIRKSLDRYKIPYQRRPKGQPPKPHNSK